MSIKGQYEKSYSNYKRSLKRFSKKYGVEYTGEIGRVKRPTAGSLRRLEKEREKVRGFYKDLRETEKYTTDINIPNAVINKEDQEAMIKLQEALDMIEEARSFVWAGSGRDSNAAGDNLVHRNAKDLYESFDDAIERYGASATLKKIEEKYGSMSVMLEMLNKLLYAVFNSGNSGFAKWSGGDARKRWAEEMNRLKDAII